ncbi:MAG: hypothetical protein NZ529_03630 [Cytophagaceae bacterium]|nr:hypothetical protein [Cytophagaceae bacterium]MDW8455861.1 hypothetical protein [Cytophagaceae bacterium]
MDIKSVNQFICDIIEKKALLNTLSYNDKNYDKVEEELHDIEDEFMDMHGDDFEEILEQVHDELDADNEILLPIAYLASEYIVKGEYKNGGKIYDVKQNEGILIDTNKIAGKSKRLVLIPNPLRLLLLVDSNKRQVVWEASE